MQKLKELINLAMQCDLDALPSYYPPPKIANRRLELYRVQFGFCAYCFNRMAKAIGRRNTVTADHIIPRVHGGNDEPDNLVGVCSVCNNKKRHTPLLIFMLNKQRSRHNLPAYKDRRVKPNREWFIEPEPVLSKQLEHFGYV